MAMFQSQQVDQTTPTVTVAQDGSGDYHGSTGDVIQEAIDSLGSGGGWVFIKPGTYNVSTTITVPSEYVTLEGVYGATSLIQVGDVTMFEVTGANFKGLNLVVDTDGSVGGSSYCWDIHSDYGEISSCVLLDTVGHGFKLRMDYGSVTNCSSYASQGLGFHVHNTTQAILSNCRASGCGSDGFWLEDCNGVSLAGCDSRLNGGRGVYVDVCNNNSSMTRCYIYGNTGKGVLVENSYYFGIENSTILDNGDTGVYIDTCYILTISTSTIDGVDYDSLHIVDSYDLVILGNLLLGNKDNLTVSNTYGVVVEGNVVISILNNGVVMNDVGGGTSQVIINGNVISSSKDSINLSNSEAIISNNTVIPTTGYGVYASSLNHIISNNRFYGGGSVPVISLVSCYENEIVGNHIYGDSTACPQLVKLDASHNNIINSNQILSFGLGGLYASSCTKLNIGGNNFRSLGFNKNGLYLEDCYTCNITSNQFYFTGGTGVSTGTAAIRLSDSSYNVVSGNNLEKAGGTVTYGYYEHGSSDYNLVGNNISRAGFGTNYFVGGSNTVVGVNGDFA